MGIADYNPPMLSATFLAFAAIHVALLAWGIKAWRTFPSTGLLLTLVPMTGLWYDCLVIGSGRFIGAGDLLYALNLPRYWIHFLLGPLWIIAVGSYARQAGFAPARRPWFIGALCALATYFIVRDGLHALRLDLHPACFADTVRYAESVAPNALCSPADPVVAPGSPPIAAIATTFAVLGLGLALGLRRHWWWLFASAVAMLAVSALPPAEVGPVFSNFGEILIVAGMVATGTFLGHKGLARSIGDQ